MVSAIGNVNTQAATNIPDASNLTKAAWQKIKGFGRFMGGEWASDVGKECFQARKNQTATLTTFDWKNSYDKYWKNRKAAADVAQKTAKSGGTLFSKIGKTLGKIPGMKFIGKHFMPILMVGTTAMSIFEGYKAGGIPEALKESTKSALSFLGYIAGTLVATAVLGFTGTLPLIVAGIAGAFLTDWVAKKVMGPSLAEQQQEQQEQETQTANAQLQSQIPKNIPLDQNIIDFINRIHARNTQNITLPDYNSLFNVQA